eukprot:267816_1
MTLTAESLLDRSLSAIRKMDWGIGSQQDRASEMDQENSGTLVSRRRTFTESQPSTSVRESLGFRESPIRTHSQKRQLSVSPEHSVASHVSRVDSPQHKRRRTNDFMSMSDVREAVSVETFQVPESDSIAKNMCETMLHFKDKDRSMPYIEAHIQLCKKRVTEISASMLQNRVHSRLSMSQSLLRERNAVQGELNTWMLLQCLQNTNDFAEKHSDEKDPDAAECFFSHERLRHKIVKHDSELRLCQAVVSWLEKIFDRGDFLASGDCSFRATLRKMQSAGGGDIDPDAADRGNTKFSAEDLSNEASMLKYVFEAIRAGDIKDAVKLCESYRQYWRAESINGGTLWNMSSDRSKTVGNQNRMLWKQTCRQLAKEGSSEWERAIYGALGGSVVSVLAVGRSWEDHCWSMFKLLSDTLLDAKMITELKNVKGFIDASPQELDPKYSSKSAIFAELERSSVAEVKSQSVSSFRRIQKLLILGDHDTLVKYLVEFAEKERCSPEFLRFSSHLLLYIESQHPSRRADFGYGLVVIRAYARRLMENEHDLVAPYVSLLLRNQRIEVYANFLEQVGDSNTQHKLLGMARQHMAGEADAIMKKLVKNVMDSSFQPVSPGRPDSPNEDLRSCSLASVASSVTSVARDERKCIAALGVTLAQKMPVTALRSANALCRQLMSGASAWISPLSSGANIQMGTGSRCEDGDMYRMALDKDRILEIRLGKISRAFELLEAMVSLLNKVEKVLHDSRSDLAAVSQSKSIENVDNATTHFMRSMRYNGGWLGDKCRPSDSENKLNQELNILRQKCVPALVFAYMRMLFESDMFERCNNLSTLVADNTFGIFRAFENPMLKAFAEMMGRCHLQLVVQSGCTSR